MFNSFSYSFMPIPLKLYMRLVHGLKMCVSFGYNPQIIFVTVSQVELSHLRTIVNGFKVFCAGTPPTVLCRLL